MTKPSAGLKHAGDLLDETRKVRIAMRSLDIDDHVEMAVRKRELLGIADLEAQPSRLMARNTMANSLRIKIEAHILRWLIRPGEIRRAAAMTAAHLEHA